MGHDMRVPLNTVISTGDMLADGAYDPLTPKQTKAVVRLQRNNRRLLAMLDDFLTYIKADAGDLAVTPAPFDPRLRLEEWCGQVRAASQEKGLTLKVTTAANVPEKLTGDEVLLSRIALALLWNAVGYTAQGEIQVTSDWISNQEWLVTVQDSGSGISNSDLPHIFEPFWRGEERPQTPTAGAGLGLPLARALAKLMSGNVLLKETRAGRSVFCVQVKLPTETSAIIS
jgi:signal transduction histidine kinase